MAPEFIVDAARRAGRVGRGGYRVVVQESSGALRVHDFGNLKSATEYANDVASESDDPPPAAYVFDDRLQFVDRGRHYAYAALALSAAAPGHRLPDAAPAPPEPTPGPPPYDETPRWLTYQDLDGPKAVRLSPGEWVIGRDVSCAIVVRDLGCSRRHAKVVIEPGRVRVVDLKSKGGTQVRGTAVAEAALRSGDELRLGTMRFRYVEGSAPTAPGPSPSAAPAARQPELDKITAALGRPQGHLREETRLEELGGTIASLTYALRAISEAFEVKLPRERVLLVRTVGELLDLIEQVGGQRR